MNTYKNINEYIKNVSKEHKSSVVLMYDLIRSVVPKCEESISYGMPTFKLHGTPLVYFSAMKGHLGFYPTPSGVKAFEKELIKQNISYSKGCIRFKYNKPLPKTLIKDIVTFRFKEEKGA